MTTGIRRNLKVGRRSFLEGLGSAALVAPFLASSSPNKARAQAGQNLVVFTWPDGLEEGWHPTGERFKFDLSDTLAALEPYKSDICVITNLKSGIAKELDAHHEGPTVLWTGSKPATTPSRLSIDQEIANAIGSTSAFDSLHFGVQTTEEGGKSQISKPFMHFGGPNNPIPAEDDPVKMYNTIFGGAQVDAEAIARLRKKRGSVLDYVHRDLARIRARVSASDRVKVDRHEETIRAIERGLEFFGKVDCEQKPETPTLTGSAAKSDDRIFPDVAAVQMDLATLALQCRLTKVVTVQLSHTDSQTRIPGVNPIGLHETMHNQPMAAKLPINKWMMEQVASFIGRLKAVDIGGGRTLLDDTLCVFGSEMAIGNHKNTPMPFIVAGGGNAYFKLGQWLHLPSGPRHTKLLTAIAHAFGLNHIETFGEYDDASSVGPLVEVQG